jgi:hypothetical protein
MGRIQSIIRKVAVSVIVLLSLAVGSSVAQLSAHQLQLCRGMCHMTSQCAIGGPKCVCDVIIFVCYETP